MAPRSDDSGAPPASPRANGLWLTAFAAAGAVICALIFRPFLPALVWSMVLVLLATPLERRLRGVLGRGWASAGVTVVFVALAILGPALFVFEALLRELVGGTVVARQMLSAAHWQAIARDNPPLAPVIAWADANVDFALVLQTLSARLGGWGESLIQGSLSGAITLLLTLYFLFYLLRDGAYFQRAIGGLLPLDEAEFARVSSAVANTIFASFYGTIAVAALQGLLAGLMFWWLGLPSPVFWGIVMGALAIVPFLGAFVIWAPAAIGLAAAGQAGSALILTVWGLFVVGLIDNVVYPILVGKRLALHSLVSFVAILGGLALFGAHGVVLGPICVSVTAVLLAIWRERAAAARAGR